MSESIDFLGREYQIGAPEKLRVGDTVIVHPAIRTDGTPSTAREPFEAIIILNRSKLCTMVPRRHTAVMNDYLFGRLELKSRE